MRQRTPTIRLMMGGIALVACVVFVFFRLQADPRLGALLVAGSVVTLALLRVATCRARLKTQGIGVSWKRLGIFFVTSLAVSITVIGAADVVFLSTYAVLEFIVLSLNRESDGRPPEPIAPTLIIGMPLAVLQSYLLRVWLWPSEGGSRQRDRAPAKPESCGRPIKKHTSPIGSTPKPP